jgi:hypothetical protein
MLTSIQKKQKAIAVKKISVQTLEEDRMKQQRMRDVLLLIESLVEREEITVKMILDCLYDIGSVNLINKKFQPKFLNRLMKWIAGQSKPVFRTIALRWFKKNCPELIANWLYSKVKF